MNALAYLGTLGFALINAPVVSQSESVEPVLLTATRGVPFFQAGRSIVVGVDQPQWLDLDVTDSQSRAATFVETMIERGFPETDCVAESLREPVCFDYLLGAEDGVRLMC